MNLRKFLLIVEALILVFSNLVSYIILNICLFVLNLLTGGIAYDQDFWINNINRSIQILAAILIIYQLCILGLSKTKNIDK